MSDAHLAPGLINLCTCVCVHPCVCLHVCTYLCVLCVSMFLDIFQWIKYMSSCSIRAMPKWRQTCANVLALAQTLITIIHSPSPSPKNSGGQCPTRKYFQRKPTVIHHCFHTQKLKSFGCLLGNNKIGCYSIFWLMVCCRGKHLTLVLPFSVQENFRKRTSHMNTKWALYYIWST